MKKRIPLHLKDTDNIPLEGKKKAQCFNWNKAIFIITEMPDDLTGKKKPLHCVQFCNFFLSSDKFFLLFACIENNLNNQRCLFPILQKAIHGVQLSD